jgi:hypothetical protein
MAVIASYAAPAPARADLPRVDIEVNQAIGDEKSAAIMVIRGKGGYRGPIGIEWRGSFSLHLEKNSYAFETRSHDNEGHNVALLGMPKENDWILNAAHTDPTLVRDALAYATARRIGHWAARTRFVELYLNGEYRGVYVLSEQPKLDKNRVAVPGAGISGGYLIEQSTTSLPRGFRGLLSGRWYGHKDPKPKHLKADRALWIFNYVSATELALAARNGRWRNHIDERVAVDYVLLQELFMNLDAFNRSTFLAKGTNRPFELGPIWDFDRSMGLTLSGEFGIAPTGWITPGRPLVRDMLADRAFAQRLVTRWSELRAGSLLPDLLGDLDRSSRELRKAQARNAQRWPATRSRPHAAEVRLLRDWLSARVAWINTNIQSLVRAT